MSKCEGGKKVFNFSRSAGKLNFCEKRLNLLKLKFRKGVLTNGAMNFVQNDSVMCFRPELAKIIDCYWN